jgi:hypothetical protein
MNVQVSWLAMVTESVVMPVIWLVWSVSDELALVIVVCVVVSMVVSALRSRGGVR